MDKVITYFWFVLAVAGVLFLWRTFPEPKLPPAAAISDRPTIYDDTFRTGRNVGEACAHVQAANMMSSSFQRDCCAPDSTLESCGKSAVGEKK